MAEPQILVINCGSSSVRYQLRRGATLLLSGTMDGIGGDEPRWRSHTGERRLAGIADHGGALAAKRVPP